MSKKEADIKADTIEAQNHVDDRGETITQMEPLMISQSYKHRGDLADIALELTAASTALRKTLPEGVVLALSELVRSMNCYYSNLIEGHDTHPIDIERAMNEDYSDDPKQRDLQLEAKAHISVQKWIDDGGLSGRVTTAKGLLHIHQRFCELLPDELLWVENKTTGKRLPVIPGKLRTHDVTVGRHIAISPGAIPRFMGRFENAYSKLGRVDAIIAAATAHHRLLWIHPFLDRNGRVARLMSYAMLNEALNTGGIWSIARGLARNESSYKSYLAACDLPRRNDLDGRGNLSEEELAKFTAFFLKTCIDQVKFMEGLVQPDRLRDRILIWAKEEIMGERLPPKTEIVLEAILYRGALSRADVPNLLGGTSRTARRVTSVLLEQGVLTSQSMRAPLKLAFPAKLASRWMPGLFPEK